VGYCTGRMILFVQNRGRNLTYNLTASSRNCVRMTLSVNECTSQMSDSTEIVRVCIGDRSGVPLKVFHVWHFPTVSTVQQHTVAQVHSDFVCCCIQTG